jgi:2-polyprenyl-3-methyl-5-hydroxy-6-metoxy-1,4-benzoquinol methylase
MACPDDAADSATQVRVVASFDRIARHATDAWDHNSHYHAYLLRHLPPGRGAALDVGAGLGGFSRLLADRFDQVEAIDFSPEMVARASAHSAGHTNLHYTCDDFMAHAYPPASFDCVACIATLHHLPAREALATLADLLKPDGHLLVLDLYRATTVGDLLISAAGAAASMVTRVVRRTRQGRALSAAWAEHAPLDHYLSIAEIERICSDRLPGARIRRHLYFRYSLIWEKGWSGAG